MAGFTTLTGPKTVDGAIRNWVNRSDIPAITILTEAQAMIFERLRVREMTGRATLTFPAATQTAALPARFLDPIGFKPHEWGHDMPFVHENTLGEYRDADGVLMSGTPSCWTIVGDTAYVNVLPDATFAGILLYYGAPAPLSGGNETNFLTSRYPTLLRYACMAKAYEHMKDQMAANYLTITMQTIADINGSNEMWRRSQYVPS